MVLDPARPPRPRRAAVHRSGQRPGARPPPGNGAGRPSQPFQPGRALVPCHRLSAPRGSALPPCDRPDAVASGRQPAPAARMDFGGPCRGPPRGPKRKAGRLAPAVARPHARLRDSPGACADPAGKPHPGRAAAAAVDRRAGNHAQDRAPAPDRGGAVHRAGHRLPEAAGPAHLVLFRDLCGPARELASARQLPGRAPCRGRASHVAHQYRPDAAFHRGRLGPRLHRPHRARRALRQLLRQPLPARPPPRPLVQLVRHAEPEAARAPLCVVRRQRQSCPLPARLRRHASRGGRAVQAGAAALARSRGHGRTARRRPCEVAGRAAVPDAAGRDPAPPAGCAGWRNGRGARPDH